MTLDAIITSPALAGMRNVRQWVVYTAVPSEKRPGKLDKQPLHYATGIPTGVNNPASWTDVQTAVATARAWGPSFGAGFCFTPDCGYWFLDLDGCLMPNGQWSPFAQQMVTQAFPGAAVEVSISGKGLHLFGRGQVPPHSNRCAGHSAEFYTADRFCAVSGTSLQGNCDTDHTTNLAWLVQHHFPPREAAQGVALTEGPRPDWRGPADDDELIRRALASRSAAGVFGGKASFADLWAADERVLASAFPPDNQHDPFDRSRADASLLQMLAFWTGADASRMARLLAQSALAREKHSREDYLNATITKACSMQREVLQDKPIEPGPAPAPATGSDEMPAMRAVEGSTFLDPRAQVEHFKGCIYIRDQHRVLVPGGDLRNPERFKSIYGGFTFAMDARNERTSRNAFEAFTESQVLRAPQADGVCFRPSLPYGAIVKDAGRTRANLWWPVEVPCSPGNVEPFLKHMALLFPYERDRKIAMCYLACFVQYPGWKFQVALLIQGAEGNGKTLLSRVIAAALGDRYVHWPKASKIAKQFNSWLLYKLAYLVEDIYTSEHVDVIEELKPMVTGGDGLEIEAKGVDQVSAEVCGNFLINTNHKDGLRKTLNDRRFIPLFCPQQSKEDILRDGMGGSYFPDIYAWLRNGGYAHVTHYLRNYPIDDEFNFALHCHRAPETSSTREAIERGLGRIEQEILEAVEQCRTGFCGGWISSIALDKLLREIRADGKVPINRRRDLLRTLGYDWHPALTRGQTDNSVLPDGGRPRLFVVRNHSSLMLTKPAEVAKAYVAAQQPK